MKIIKIIFTLAIIGFVLIPFGVNGYFLIRSLFPYHRTCSVLLPSVSYQLKLSEVEHDSILRFVLYDTEQTSDSLVFFTRDFGYSGLSFMLRDNSDSIYFVRDYTEADNPYTSLRHSEVYIDSGSHPVVRKIPSKALFVRCSDPRYFRFDSLNVRFVLKDSTQHLYRIEHEKGQRNTYYLLEESYCLRRYTLMHLL